MRSLYLRLSAAALVVVLAGCASAPPVAAPAPRPGGFGRLEVTVTGFDNEEGQARIAVYLDPRSWPDGEEFVFATDLLAIREGRAAAVFEDVPAGPFAVSVFHDKNENAELDADFLGIPSEDYGFSADARDMFGPPSFEEACLELAAGESKQITIEVK
jgi:uncharacterized protein (DUF2141 family)